MSERRDRDWQVAKADFAFVLLANGLMAPFYAVAVVVGWLCARGAWDLGASIIISTVVLFWIFESVLFWGAVWSFGERQKPRAVTSRYALGSRLLASPLAAWMAGGFTGRAALFGLVVGAAFAGVDFVRPKRGLRRRGVRPGPGPRGAAPSHPRRVVVVGRTSRPGTPSIGCRAKRGACGRDQTTYVRLRRVDPHGSGVPGRPGVPEPGGQEPHRPRSERLR